jgi:membrane protein DedA with SNARE-associated domain
VDDLLAQHGLWILFAILAVQAAGVPGPPGKTALTVAAVLAADGRLVLWQVLAVAALAVLVGGAAGYVVGRTAGRRIVEQPRLAARVEPPLVLAERFFDAHGGKALVVARFVPGVKVVITLAAGIVRMRALLFALWHTVAAVVFAVGWGLTAYLLGAAALELVERIGLYAVAPLALLLYVGWRFRRRMAPRLRRLSPLSTASRKPQPD